MVREPHVLEGVEVAVAHALEDDAEVGGLGLDLLVSKVLLQEHLHEIRHRYVLGPPGGDAELQRLGLFRTALASATAATAAARRDDPDEQGQN